MERVSTDDYDCDCERGCEIATSVIDQMDRQKSYRPAGSMKFEQHGVRVEGYFRKAPGYGSL